MDQTTRASTRTRTASCASPTIVRARRSALERELDVLSRDVLLAATAKPEYRARDLEIDTQELSFIDRAGLGSLVIIADTRRAEGRRCTISRGGAALARLCALTDTGHLLGLAPRHAG